MSQATPRRALIVIDVQNEYDAGGGLPIEYPPFAQSLQRIAAAMDAAQAAGVPVIVVPQARHAAPRSPARR
jgi:nicotinamidase-related amidase